MKNKSIVLLITLLIASFCLFATGVTSATLYLKKSATSGSTTNGIVLTTNLQNVTLNFSGSTKSDTQILNSDLTISSSSATSESNYCYLRVKLSFTTSSSKTSINNAVNKMKYMSLSTYSGNYYWTRVGEYYYLFNSSSNLPEIINSTTAYTFIQASNFKTPIFEGQNSSTDVFSINVSIESVQSFGVSQTISAVSTAFNSLYGSNTTKTLTITKIDNTALTNTTVTTTYGSTISLTGDWNTDANGNGADITSSTQIFENLVIYKQ